MLYMHMLLTAQEVLLLQQQTWGLCLQDQEIEVEKNMKTTAVALWDAERITKDRFLDKLQKVTFLILKFSSHDNSLFELRRSSG